MYLTSETGSVSQCKWTMIGTLLVPILKSSSTSTSPSMLKSSVLPYLPKHTTNRYSTPIATPILHRMHWMGGLTTEMQLELVMERWKTFTKVTFQIQEQTFKKIQYDYKWNFNCLKKKIHLSNII